MKNNPISWESCSTFLLKTGDSFLIGHNLDERTAEAQPGSIYINKPGEYKTGLSFKEVFTGKKPNKPSLTWTSIYGSVTFSSLGKNFIDGGYNEVGLYIQEMSLEGGALPEATEENCLFMTLWMQYVLDNFTSVAEVIESLSSITIDGWPWHFFICDSNDNHTCIDFVGGQSHIYSGEKMPYAVMTNYQYYEELKGLKPYQGFGGAQRVDLSDLGDLDPPRNTRFIHACHLIENASEKPDIEEAFNILYAMDRTSLRPPGGRHWSYVIDVSSNKIYIETRTSTQRKFIDLGKINFADNSPSSLIDIHLDQKGDVTDCFEDVTVKSNRAALERCIVWWEDLFKMVIPTMESRGESVLDVYKQGSWQSALEIMATHIKDPQE